MINLRSKLIEPDVSGESEIALSSYTGIIFERAEGILMTVEMTGPHQENFSHYEVSANSIRVLARTRRSPRHTISQLHDAVTYEKRTISIYGDEAKRARVVDASMM